jgi:allantoate deiminase
VGSLHVSPGADNVIAGSVCASLDVRHADDAVRRDAVKRLVDCACQIAARRRLAVQWEPRLDQPAVVMDAGLTDLLGDSKLHRITSGAGHDAMIVARRMPAAMLFLRSPGGISHHPDETVLVEDVAAALDVGMGFLERLETRHV